MSSFARTMARAKRRDLHRGAQAARAKAPDVQYRQPRATLEQAVRQLMEDPEFVRIRAALDEHAVYDRGDPVAEGRRGWMTHPAGEPNRPDKGQRDGSCNRTACQDNLAGRPRWSMAGSFTGGPRLYYCPLCRDQFHAWDVRSGDPVRCYIHPGDEL